MKVQFRQVSLCILYVFYFQKSSDIADEIIEPQPLWEYPCCARSDVQQVFTFDYNDFVKKKSLPYKIETKLNINR